MRVARSQKLHRLNPWARGGAPDRPGGSGKDRDRPGKRDGDRKGGAVGRCTWDMRMVGGARTSMRR